MAEETIAVTLVQTLISENSDNGINNRLLGETKRLGKWWMVAGEVMTTAGIVIIDTIKELSWLMGVNLLTQAAETGENTRVVSTIVAVVARVSRSQRRHSRGKQLEKLAYAEPELRNRSSAIRIIARDITKGC